MPPKIPRSDFLKWSALSGAAALWGACNSPQEKRPIPKPAVPRGQYTAAVRTNFPPLPTLYRKGEPGYDALRSGFNKRIDRYPAAIALCTTADDVAGAVGYALEHRLPIAIKSGGHSFEGYSCNDDGMVINLSRMNTIKWLDDHTIEVGPGCLLHQLYETVLPAGKILPAGSCGTVGIGGLALGGGYGLFSRRFGLTCDSLSGLTMVDAAGRILSVRDPDRLMWACKGGGNGSFGVVTSMVFTLSGAPETLQSTRFRIRLHDPAAAVTMLEEWFDSTAALPDSCFSSYVLNGPSLYVLLTNCGPENDVVQKITHRLAARFDRTSVGIPLPLPHAVGAFYGRPGPIYFKNASAGFYHGFDELRACILQVLEKVMATPGMIYQVNTLGGRITDPALARLSSFAHRDKSYLAELQTYWNSPSETAACVAAFNEVQQLFFHGGITSQYTSYPDSGLANWETAYFGTNYPELQKVKRQLDPGNLFRHPQGILP